MHIISKEYTLEQISNAMNEGTNPYAVVKNIKPLYFRSKWIKVEDKFSYQFHCKHCGEEVPYNRYGRELFSKFCPHCGYQMLSDIGGKV